MTTVQQKLVDCLLSIDAIDAASDDAVTGVVLVSDDRDIVPGALRAASSGKAAVELWTSNSQSAEELRPTVEPYGLVVQIFPKVL